MPPSDFWNHNALLVSPENMRLLQECLDTLFSWKKTLYEKRENAVGYQLRQNGEQALLYLEAAPWAGQLDKALHRLRKVDQELDQALQRQEAASPASVDHFGVRVESLEEWQQRLRIAKRLEKDRPDLHLKVTVIEKPVTKGGREYQVHQCYIKIGLLGPVRNTFEMSCIVPSVS